MTDAMVALGRIGRGDRPGNPDAASHDETFSECLNAGAAAGRPHGVRPWFRHAAEYRLRKPPRDTPFFFVDANDQFRFGRIGVKQRFTLGCLEREHDPEAVVIVVPRESTGQCPDSPEHRNNDSGSDSCLVTPLGRRKARQLRGITPEPSRGSISMRTTVSPAASASETSYRVASSDK